MNNIVIITKREYLTQVKKKSFVILTLLAPLMIIAFGALVGIMFKANKSTLRVDVVDRSGLFTNQLKSDDAVTYTFIPENQEKEKTAKLKDNEKSDGVLVIPALVNKDYDLLGKTTSLIINTKIGFETKQHIVSDLSDIIKKEKIKELGISQKTLDNLDQHISLKTINVSDNNNEDSDMAFGVKSGLSMVLMYVTFMFIIMYGVRVMRSVLEEKNNRVVEIIISSVKPFELMLGKILGVTFVALTQFSIWILMSVIGAIFLNTGFGALQENLSSVNSNFDILQIATQVSHHLLELNFPLIITVFVLYFLLGYLFYSSIYAAVGSAVDNETETQQFTLFAILPLMLGMYGSFSIMNNPDGPMGFWLSIIPFTSPVAMIARIPFGVPVWQIALSIGLLVVTTIGMVFLAGKVYRVGILMYGNKATMKEIWKWIRN